MTGALQEGMKEEQLVGPSSKGSTSFRNFTGRETTTGMACHLEERGRGWQRESQKANL